MPVPETYSRRYGREESYTFSSRSSSRPSYLSSYTSKLTSSLPPRPPLYEHRKLSESSSTSRFLSSSASRTRDYGASSYRSSVSPVRATSSVLRRTLDSSSSISERLKSLELDREKDLTGKYSTRTRDSALSSSTKSYTSPYSRERSGSRELPNSPLTTSPAPLSIRDREPLKSSELIRSRSSSTGSTSVSRAVGRNGVSRLGSEVNTSSVSESTSSASKGVTTTTTTTTVNDEDDKCGRDVENNDADSLESSSSSVSVTNTEEVNLSINMNGNDEKVKVKDVVVAPERKRVKSVSQSAMSKDSNGNPISIDMKDECGQRVTKISSGQSVCSGGKDVSTLVEKCESDKNANVVEGSKASVSEHSARDSIESVVVKSKSSLQNSSSSSSRSNPKVIYHSFRVEEKEPSPEPAKYTITSTSSASGGHTRLESKSVPSGTDTSAEFNISLPRIRQRNLPTEQRHSNSSYGTDIGSTKPNNKETSPESMTSNNFRGSNSGSSGTPSSPGVQRKYMPKKNEKTPPLEEEKIRAKVDILRKSSPVEQVTSRKSPPVESISSRKSPPVEQVTSRKSPPVEQVTSRKSPPVEQVQASSKATRSPSPHTTARSSTSKPSSPKTNGEANVNSTEMGGPHSSKFAYAHSGHTETSNRNDRDRVSRAVGYSNTSDSSDNDSDAYSSSPQLGGRFRARDTSERSGLTGLRNIGNTCFMNSVLQCLSNTKPLLEYVVKNGYVNEINTTTSGMKGALIRAFGELIKELWRESRTVDTSAFKDQIQRFAPRFMGYSQQDAQEFLRYLLEGLHEDVNTVTEKPKPILTDIDDELSDTQKAAEAWKRYLRYENSRILDIFVGQLKSTLKCTTCGHCSVTFDPFWDLSLSIPSRSSQTKLSQCFELFTKEEVMDGDEKPTCAKCQCRRKCTKSLSIQKFPKILVIHLKRFSPTERFRGKLSTTVDFPLNGLDMSQYAASRGQGSSYNLYGIANHSGSTYSGHYIAYCKHPYSGEWHCYNDSRVSPISSHSVVSSEGYVLFYEIAGQSSQL